MFLALCSWRYTNPTICLTNLIRIVSTSNSFVINNIGKHDGDQFGNTGDNYKLLCLGWKPNVNLSEGIMNFYKYAEGVL